MKSRRNPANLVVVEVIKEPKYRTVRGTYAWFGHGQRELVEKGEYRPLWVLAPSVTQEGSHYFTNTIDNENYRQFVIGELDKSVSQLFAALSVGQALANLG